jgi:6-phosphogluconolactonase (cycloisomerase 2 family)/endonuclease/exonuclease/phosphatase family metal-dependent hydrolase
MTGSEPLEFLAVDPTGRTIHALGRERVQTFSFDPAVGRLAKRGEVETGVRGTHLEWDRQRDALYVATYSGHAVAMLPLDESGLPGASTARVGGPDATQTRNAHQARIDPRGSHLYVPCLGSDLVAILRPDPGRGTLSLVGTASTGAGTGPRHLDFHPTGEHAYVLNERASSLSVFAMDRTKGTLALIRTTSALDSSAGSTNPSADSGSPSTDSGSRSSDVHVTPDGRYLLAMHREPRDEIVVFSLDDAADPVLVSRTPTGGRHARTFALDPSARYVVTANAQTSNLSVFRFTSRGALIPLSVVPTTAVPWCVQMVDVKSPPRARDPDPSSVPLDVMSYNVRYGTADDGDNRWENRREALLVLVKARKPHVLGIQEALGFQLEELAKTLPDHRVLGRDRRGGSDDEHSSLLVDARRLLVVEHGQFWLAPDPDEVGIGWDAALPRICVWAILEDRRTQGRFLAMNTHFDHRGAEARNQSAIQLAAFADRHDLPVVLLGDLNAGETSAPLRTLRAAGFRDSFRVIHQGREDAGTFTDFAKVTSDRKIDYILVRGAWRVRGASIVDERYGDRYPSDHLPVAARVSLP